MTRYKMTCLLAALALFSFAGTECSAADGPFHHFGGQSLTLPIKMPACENFRAQLYTTTGAMEAPVGDPVMGDCASPVALQLPTVKVKTSLTLEVETATGGDFKPVGSALIHVYPADVLLPLQNWAQNNVLFVADSDGKLEKFFDDAKIPFAVHRQKQMKPPTAHVLAGQGEILFEEEADGLPKIVIEGQSIRIKMPFLDRLASDPSFQYELVQLFEKIL